MEKLLTDTVYEALRATFEQVKEPGKSALVIDLDYYARDLTLGVETLRKMLVRLHYEKRICARKMRYPAYVPESWEVMFPADRR